jgi:diguanylate cyclase (GGDEF)-like protein/PAS domain S-box-containing protein
MKVLAPRFSLGTWLTGAVIATALAAVLATVALVEAFARRHAEQQANSSLRQVAWNMRDALDKGMQQHFEQMRALAALEPLRDSRDAAAVRLTLDQLKTGFPQFAWVGLTDPSGHVFASTGGLLEGVDVTKRPWYAGAQQGPYVGDVHAAVLLAKLLPQQAEPWRFVDIAVPVDDASGAPRGILATHLSWEWARATKEELIEPTLRDRGADVLVLGRDGLVLLGPKALEGHKLDVAALLANPAGAELPASGATGIAKHTERFGLLDFDGAQTFTAVAPTRGAGRYPGLGWIVVVRQSADLALADYRTLRNEILAAGLAVCGVFCFIAAFVARRLSTPLRRLTAALDNDGADVDLDRIGLYREAHQLATALRAMSQRQQQHAGELRAMNNSLEARISQRTVVLEATNRQLGDAQRLLRGVTDNLPVLISYLDTEQRVQFYNDTFRSWFGVDPSIHLGREMADVVGAGVYETRRPFVERALGGERVQFTATVQTRVGPRHLDTTFVPHLGDDGEVLGLYALSSDVSVLKEAERRLESLARVDTLTGLPNRLQLNERLPEALARGRRSGEAVAVLFIDVDRFKEINDTLGHPAGDAVLREFARRMRECVRDTDLVARLAGDEFVIVLEGLQGAGEPQMVARKVVERLRQPIRLGDDEITVSGSVGIAFDPLCASQPEDLIARADQALYEAKRSGRSTFRMLLSH